MVLDIGPEVDRGEVPAGGSLHHVFGLLQHLRLGRLDAPFGDDHGSDPDRGEQRERECCPAETDVCVADVDLDGVHAHLVDEGGDSASVNLVSTARRREQAGGETYVVTCCRVIEPNKASDPRVHPAAPTFFVHDGIGIPGMQFTATPSHPIASAITAIQIGNENEILSR